MQIKFTIPGEPQGKGRPRFAHVGGRPMAFTPDKTALYENLVAMEYRHQCGGKRFADHAALVLEIYAYYTIPASASRKRRNLMQTGQLRPTKKPDWDNIGKIVADSLNQVAYRDDAQIVEARVWKYYASSPRVEVILSEMEDMKVG